MGFRKIKHSKDSPRTVRKDDDTVVVYFDGWSFENFDDAKMALIQGIVDALESNENFRKVKDDAKGAMDAVTEAFVKLKNPLIGCVC